METCHFLPKLPPSVDSQLGLAKIPVGLDGKSVKVFDELMEEWDQCMKQQPNSSY